MAAKIRQKKMGGKNSTLFLNLCGIVAAILKMATDRNFSISGHHYLPTISTT
jgi:hypothetical protein